jgi:hypothetical protein
MTQQGFTNYPTTNGRIDIISPSLNNQFELSDKIPVHTTAAFRDAMTGNWMNTPLSLAYFSSENINIIQNNIRKGVYNKSNSEFVIGLQDEDELKIIMRSVFLQNSLNLENNIREQIRDLNSLVESYSIDQVYKEAISYLKYKRDASNMYALLALPSNSSTRGKTLELQRFV